MLKGKKITLRLVTEGDLDAFILTHHNLESRGDYFPLRVESGVEIRKRFSDTGFWCKEYRLLVIVDNETEKILGSIVAFSLNRYPNCYEIGYLLDDVSRRGQGIMTEAVHLFCDYLFRLENIFRLQLTTTTGNIASRRTAEKAGFTHEGTMRQILMERSRPLDLELYSLLRSEFESKNAS